MITRDLFDATIAELVETRGANVSDRGRSILDDGDCEDARHAVPFRTSGRQKMNLVVGDGNRLADAFAHGAGLALEPLAQHAQCDISSFSAGGLPADTVDDDEQPARRVNVEAILVDLTREAGIGGAGGRDRAERRHIE